MLGISSVPFDGAYQKFCENWAQIHMNFMNSLSLKGRVKIFGPTVSGTVAGVYAGAKLGSLANFPLVGAMAGGFIGFFGGTLISMKEFYAPAFLEYLSKQSLSLKKEREIKETEEDKKTL